MTMYLSQPKVSFLRPDMNLNVQNKQNKQNVIPPSKISVPPPKMHRTSSYCNNLYSNQSVHTSLSKEDKTYRDFSKNKVSAYLPTNSLKLPLSANSSISNFAINESNLITNKDYMTHRYSCHTDRDKSSDQFNYKTHSSGLYQRKGSQTQLQKRVIQLQEKMKKNQENLRYYSQQIQHFKHQFSSSTSNLIDSINTNILTVSTKQAFRQNSLIQNQVNNRQNLIRNTLSTESITNSPRETEIQKRIKQIDLIKKQLKKIMNKDDIMKGDMKMFQLSIKEVLTGFKEYLSQSIEQLSKRQEKNKKRIFDKVTEDIQKRFKQLTSIESQYLKNNLSNVKINQVKKGNKQSMVANKNIISKSKQRFLKDPILIKIKQEVYGLVKKAVKNPFQSYQEMIKKSINQSLGTVNSFHNANINSFASNLRQGQLTEHTKISLQQTQTTYYIDQQGHLLDFEGFYLLQQQQKIKLNYLQIQKLKQTQILQQISEYRIPQQTSQSKQ